MESNSSAVIMTAGQAHEAGYLTVETIRKNISL